MWTIYFQKTRAIPVYFMQSKSISCMANNKITDSETLQQKTQQDAARDNGSNFL